MNADDRERMGDILTAARDAVSFAKGRTRSDLMTDRMFFLAMVKAVEIIGEAASRVSAETRNQYAQIPWVSMIGMRNILVHAYRSIDINEFWSTVENDLPPLIAELEQILPPEEDADA